MFNQRKNKSNPYIGYFNSTYSFSNKTDFFDSSSPFVGFFKHSVPKVDNVDVNLINKDKIKHNPNIGYIIHSSVTNVMNNTIFNKNNPFIGFFKHSIKKLESLNNINFGNLLLDDDLYGQDLRFMSSKKRRRTVVPNQKCYDIMQENRKYNECNNRIYTYILEDYYDDIIEEEFNELENKVYGFILDEFEDFIIKDDEKDLELTFVDHPDLSESFIEDIPVKKKKSLISKIKGYFF